MGVPKAEAWVVTALVPNIEDAVVGLSVDDCVVADAENTDDVAEAKATVEDVVAAAVEVVVAAIVEVAVTLALGTAVDTGTGVPNTDVTGFGALSTNGFGDSLVVAGGVPNMEPVADPPNIEFCVVTLKGVAVLNIELDAVVFGCDATAVPKMETAEVVAGDAVLVSVESSSFVGTSGFGWIGEVVEAAISLEDSFTALNIEVVLDVAGVSGCLAVSDFISSLIGMVCVVSTFELVATG